MAQYTPPESLHVGTGVETVFGFNFPYLVASDLKVTVNGGIRATVLASPYQVQINPAPALNSEVRIYRDTPAQQPAYLFDSGIPFLPKYVDTNNKQLLHAVQEGLLAFQFAQETADAALTIASRADAAAAVAMNRSVRAVRAPDSDPEMRPLANVEARAGKVMGFNDAGDPIGTLPATGSGTELALDLASTGAGKGAAMVGVRHPEAESRGRTLYETFTDTVYLRDFVVGDGITDDSDGMQAALNAASGSRPRHIDCGDVKVLITKPLFTNPCVLLGTHGGTNLIFRGMAGQVGIQVLSTDQVGRHYGAIGVNFIASQGNLKRGMAGPVNSSQYFTYYLRAIFCNNLFRGENRIQEKYSFGWDYGAEFWVQIGDCVGADVQGNYWQGCYDIQQPMASQFMDGAILIEANGAVLSLRMAYNNVGPCGMGLVMGNRAFATVAMNDFIGNWESIVWRGTLLLNEPKVFFNNMNAQRAGVTVDGPDTLDFAGNTVRRHRSGTKLDTHDWYGFYLKNVSDIKVHGNTVQPDNGGGVFAGQQTAYYMEACGLGTVMGNFVGPGPTRGMHFHNCQGMTVDNTITAQNAAVDTLFYLTGNTRMMSFGMWEQVSSWKGTPYYEDATITATINKFGKTWDHQGTGNIEQDVTRKNAPVDQKKWRTSTSVSSQNRQIVRDDGTSVNVEIISRSGAVITSIEWRAGTFILNNGASITPGAGSPEGVHTAAKGSLWLRSDSAGPETVYIKETVAGNTGWRAL